jgi:hypothetical protein
VTRDAGVRLLAPEQWTEPVADLPGLWSGGYRRRRAAPCRRGETMSTVERRSAARANQRAAAFIRFQMLGDHEAMRYLLLDVGENERSRLEFTTALASIAGSVAAMALGRDQALAYLRSVAESSAALSDADDIDRYFDS